MIGILIFILFMLNIFLILAVIILYQRQNRFTEIEQNQKKIQQESEEMLSAFLMEFKEENELFVSKVKNLNSTTKPSNDIPSSKVEFEQEKPISSEAYSRLLASEVYQNSSENINEQEIEKTFAEQVEDLVQKGLSSSEIAKQLKKGKTEVELLLKFHENRK